MGSFAKNVWTQNKLLILKGGFLSEKESEEE